MDELQSIVDLMIPLLEESLKSAPSSFRIWFGDFKLLSLTDTEAVFSTPSDLRLNILSTRYHDVIKDTVSQIIGFPVEIRIVKDPAATPMEEKKTDIPDASQLSPEEKEENIKREKKIIEILDTDSPDRKNVLDEYTFENFIEGASNKFAKAACFAVANNPATDYNPLFIHGHSGLGKTHLLCAVINYMKKKYPALRIVYKKSEDFINELIASLKTGSTQSFKDKYRSADVLLIDDIQFLAGKESTQEEFFHTFSTLYESNKQIILTSDRPPNEIRPLEERLRTRFEGGLIADIQPPSPELRIAIIKKKSEDLHLNLSDELIHYLAERLHENIRQIEGVMKKLQAVLSLTNTPASKEEIEKVISVIDPGNVPANVMVARILSAVCQYYGVPEESLKSKKKTENIANARHVAIYLIRKNTDKSFKEIGDIFGRDHSTVMSSYNKIELEFNTSHKTAADINKITSLIKE